MDFYFRFIENGTNWNHHSESQREYANSLSHVKALKALLNDFEPNSREIPHSP